MVQHTDLQKGIKEVNEPGQAGKYVEETSCFYDDAAQPSMARPDPARPGLTTIERLYLRN